MQSKGRLRSDEKKKKNAKEENPGILTVTEFSRAGRKKESLQWEKVGKKKRILPKKESNLQAAKKKGSGVFRRKKKKYRCHLDLKDGRPEGEGCLAEENARGKLTTSSNGGFSVKKKKHHPLQSKSISSRKKKSADNLARGEGRPASRKQRKC